MQRNKRNLCMPRLENLRTLTDIKNTYFQKAHRQIGINLTMFFCFVNLQRFVAGLSSVVQLSYSLLVLGVEPHLSLGMKSEMDVAMNPLAVSLHILGEIGITDFSADVRDLLYSLPGAHILHLLGEGVRTAGRQLHPLLTVPFLTRVLGNHGGRLVVGSHGEGLGVLGRKHLGRVMLL